MSGGAGWEGADAVLAGLLRQAAGAATGVALAQAVECRVGRVVLVEHGRLGAGVMRIEVVEARERLDAERSVRVHEEIVIRRERAVRAETVAVVLRREEAEVVAEGAVRLDR